VNIGTNSLLGKQIEGVKGCAEMPPDSAGNHASGRYLRILAFSLGKRGKYIVVLSAHLW
jgi:hypothetical protein